MHIFLNALGATCASGITYLRNVLPHLSKESNVYTTVAVNLRLRHQFANLPNISFCDFPVPAGVARRFWFEQTELPHYIRRSGADVLISAGNFALRNSPVPQILLSGNSLYTNHDFPWDLCSRREYRLFLDHYIKSFFARQSICWSDATIAPSQAFADELRRWTGREIVNIHHGFDPDVFFADDSPLGSDVQEKLASAGDSLRLLFVSHYNYYRNFETLLRAIPPLQARLGRKVRVFLTCHLRREDNLGFYRADRAATLVRQFGIDQEVVELGSIPYGSLHHIYKWCDLYVTAAYAESFAHPLVEAMACGTPVIASDLPVHKEVCGRAALYFPRFSAEDLCAQIVKVAECPSLREELSKEARMRCQNFSWAKHVRELLALVFALAREREGKVGRTSLAGYSSLDVEPMPQNRVNANNESVARQSRTALVDKHLLPKRGATIYSKLHEI